MRTLTLTALLGAAAVAALPTAAAQVPPGEQPARVASIPLDPPDVELGEEFRDDDYGFSFRLPKGFELLPDADLQRLRETDIVPEDQLPEVDGKKARVQVWKFENREGANIYVLMNEPPVAIESPTHLRGAINEPDKQRGRPIENVGKLYQFQARGSRIGYMVSREFGIEPGKPTTLTQSIAYLRGTNRSFIVRCTAPKETFADVEGPFQAAMVTFAILRAAIEPLQDGETDAKSTSLTSTRTVGNVVLLLVILFGGALAWRKSSVASTAS